VDKDKKYRQSQKDRGLTLVREWIPNEFVDQHKAHAEKMRKKADRRKK